MVKKVVSIGVISLFAILVGFMVFSEDKEKDKTKITKAQVPKAVIAAFEKAYPKATVKEYEQKTKDKEIWYEIEYTDGAVTREVKYKADGTLVGTEEDIAVKDLPEAVSKAIASKYPGATITGAEKETRDGAVKYEVELQVKGKKQEVKLTDKGEVIPRAEHKDKD